MARTTKRHGVFRRPPWHGGGRSKHRRIFERRRTGHRPSITGRRAPLLHKPAVSRRLISHLVRRRNRRSFGATPQRHSNSSSLRKGGIFHLVTPTTPRVTSPPKMTDRTAPNSLAATPDSNEPISFEEPMKIWLTAETRPSMCGG